MMASLDEAFPARTAASTTQTSRQDDAPYFGMVFPHPGPDPTVMPYYAASIRKNDAGQLYVDDARWFGRFMLPADAKHDDVIRISKSRLARISLPDEAEAVVYS